MKQEMITTDQIRDAGLNPKQIAKTYWKIRNQPYSTHGLAVVAVKSLAFADNRELPFTLGELVAWAETIKFNKRSNDNR